MASTTSPSASPTATVGAGWARERLWLGMSNVGFWVLLACVGVVTGAPDLGLGPADAVLLLGAYVLLQAPFDVIGGWWLPRRHDRGARSFGAFALAWFRGAAATSVTLALAVTGALVLGRMGGGIAVWAGAAVGMVLLVGLQGPYCWFVSGLRTRPATQAEASRASRAGLEPSVVKVVDAHDPGFVGGWVGLPGAETLVIPASWWDVLGEDGWIAQLRRRQVARAGGQRLRGVLIALAFNLVGLGLALALFGAGDPDAVVRTIAAFTLWSFLGLLSLPTPSRRGVMAVDRAAVQAGNPEAVLVTALRQLDVLQDDEPDRSAVVETIFHPVPALGARVQALHDGEAAPAGGAWDAARMALLTSAVAGSPLSRAVHCNIGRPELWAIYPGD